MKNIVKTSILIAAACSFAACSANSTKSAKAVTGPAEETVTNVEVVEASKKDVPQDETYSTTVQAYAINNIAPQSGARIKKINVEVGDFVSAGQVLAQMDDLSLVQAELKLANDSTEFGRIRKLFEEGGVSKSDYESMELAYKVSKSSYQNLLENTVLRSPISGVVTARNYDRGDMYAMASPIYVVQQITPVKLLVGISETDYTKVKRGDEVIITVDAIPEREFKGRISRIYPTIDMSSHTFSVEVVVNNADRVLRPGMYAKVNVTFAINNSIVVPDVAVQKQQGSGVRTVYIVNPDGTVSISEVTVGRHIGSEYELLSGVNEGEKVVVKGHAALKNGSKVTF